MITQNKYSQQKPNIKAMEITDLSKIYPQQFENLASHINQTEENNHSAKYYHTIVRKEAGWFGQKIVNLILKFPLDNEQQPILFYEKTIEVNEHIQYVPTQPIKYVLLSDVKMVARGSESLNIAFLVEKKKIEQWNFIFYEKKLVQQWEVLLKNQQNQFKKLKTQKNQKENKIKDLLSKISSLQQEIKILRMECEQLFSAKETIENQNRNLYRQNITLIQQNSSLYQTKTKYRKFLFKLEHQKSFIQEKKRKSIPTKTQNFFDSEQGIAIFYISQSKWKQCLSKIERTCSSIQQTITKNEERNRLSQLSEQLQTSVKSLKSSVILLASKDIRKSQLNQINERVQVT